MWNGSYISYYYIFYCYFSLHAIVFPPPYRPALPFWKGKVACRTFCSPLSTSYSKACLWLEMAQTSRDRQKIFISIPRLNCFFIYFFSGWFFFTSKKWKKQEKSAPFPAKIGIARHYGRHSTLTVSWWCSCSVEKADDGKCGTFPMPSECFG